MFSSDQMFCGSLNDDSFKEVIRTLSCEEVSEVDFIVFAFHIETEEGPVPFDTASEIGIAELEDIFGHSEDIVLKIDRTLSLSCLTHSSPVFPILTELDSTS